MSERLKGKVAIITGGGRGIGRSIALSFAGEGANIVPISRRKSLAECQKVAAKAEDLGAKALPLSADVSVKGDVQATVQQVLDTFGTIDILVNNAGIAKHNPVVDILEEDWDRTMAVNLKGVFLCTQAVLPTLIEKRSGSIINISSMAGKHGSAGYGAYSTSKFGLMGFTECLVQEVRPHNIRVHVICPGPVASVLRASNHPSDVQEELMQPEDIAEVALQLVTQHERAFVSEVHVRTMWM